MARRTHLTAVSLLLLGPVIAGCAATAPPPTTQVFDSPVYLEGVTTEYSKRLDQIQAQHATNSSRRMPGAVVAKDKRTGVVAVASLHRVGANYTLDVIVHNHGLEPVELPRTRVRLYDHMGLQLAQIDDWNGAAEIGLRAGLRNQERDQEQEFTDDLHLASMLDANEGITTGPTTRPTKSNVRETGQRTPASGTNLAGPSFSRVSGGHDQVKAPEVLRVDPEASKPYWVYFNTEGRELTMPLTAVVQLGDRGLLFRFEAPVVR